MSTLYGREGRGGGGESEENALASTERVLVNCAAAAEAPRLWRAARAQPRRSLRCTVNTLTRRRGRCSRLRALQPPPPNPHAPRRPRRRNNNISFSSITATCCSECWVESHGARIPPPPPPPPSPPSRTKWTRLVHPSVLIGHAASQVMHAAGRSA